MPKFASGVVRFQQEVFPARKELFRRLADGQAPEALFITCSDSRIDPNLLTGTDPGDLFICRNAGNIVPPHSAHTGAMTAAIEFALGVLKVPHIVLCGHSNCGAMQGLLDPGGLDRLPHVREWLAHARAAAEIVSARAAELGHADRLRQVTEENVGLQLAHLETHPYAAKALAAGKLTLHGWVYDIAEGEVRALDRQSGRFRPVAAHYGAAGARSRER